MLEGSVQQQIRLAGAEAGLFLWRNNVGACTDETGRLIRYGLGNDSAAMNRAIKSPDLVGIRPLLITPEWVGRVVGVFGGVEVKASDWVERPNDPHTTAQRAFHDIVRAAGGFAGFATSVDEMKQIMRLPL